MKLTQKKLYIISLAAFSLALIKYFIGSNHISGTFIIFECLSFLAFLTIIYACDKLIQTNKKQVEKYNILIEELKIDHKKEINNLETKLKLYQQAEIQASEDEQKLNEIRAELNLITDKQKNRSKSILSTLSHHFEIGFGLYYQKQKPSEEFTVQAHYGLSEDATSLPFKAGDGLNGQAVVDKKTMVVRDIDQDYLTIESSSGYSTPTFLYLLPVIKNNEVIGLIELASFTDLGIERYWETINEIINSFIIN